MHAVCTTSMAMNIILHLALTSVYELRSGVLLATMSRSVQHSQEFFVFLFFTEADLEYHMQVLSV